MMNASREGLYEAFSCQLPLPFLAPMLFFSFLLVQNKAYHLGFIGIMFFLFLNQQLPSTVGVDLNTGQVPIYDNRAYYVLSYVCIYNTYIPGG